MLGKVKFPPVKIKLHWPDLYCKDCLQECTVVATEIYWCPSCNKYTAGRTEYIEGKVVASGTTKR